MYELQFLQSLGLTIVLETVLLFLLLRVYYRIDRSTLTTSSIFWGGIVASSATLPYIWFILPVFMKDAYAYALTAESFAVCAEAGMFVFLFKFSLKRALAVSCLCNLPSYIVGELFKIFS